LTTPDDPQWSDEEIEAKRDDAPAQQADVIEGIAPVSQDPDLFPLDDEVA
jgi:hypothetical protein